MPTAKPPSPLLKLALELGPLAVFFLVNARLGTAEGIYPATAAFMVATAVALVVSYGLTRHLPIMPLVSGAVVLVFGTLTLVLHNDLFIKLKPTIVNALFGTALIGGLLFGKSLLGVVFDSVLRLDEAGWRKLTLRWGLFFYALAILNEIVWRNSPPDKRFSFEILGMGFSADYWVTFKVFGIMPLTLLFALAQVPLLMRHAIEDDEGAAPGATDDNSAGGGI